MACGDVHMHLRSRRALQDTMTAIRHHVPVAGAGLRLYPNGEQHAQPGGVQALYPLPLLRATPVTARHCLTRPWPVRYQYPRELVPKGPSAATWLRTLTEEGIAPALAAGGRRGDVSADS